MGMELLTCLAQRNIIQADKLSHEGLANNSCGLQPSKVCMDEDQLPTMLGKLAAAVGP